MEVMTTEKAFECIANNMFKVHSVTIFNHIKKMELRIEELEREKRKAYLKQKEVCSEFGIGHSTLKNWVSNGLPEIWIENRVYYDRKDIETYMDKHKI
ncbi:helix-turn-helix domain-containing protein [Ruoffia sp. FAM 20857]